MPPNEFRTTFETLQTNMQNFRSQLDIPTAEAAPDTQFKHQQFWSNLLKISEKLGFEANKVTIMWINKPLPSNSDMIGVCGALEIATVALLNSFHSLPSSEGKLVRNKLKSGLTDIFEHCVSFSTALLNSVESSFTNQDHPLVMECGLLMESCSRIKLLPQSNRLACVENLNSEAHVIKDALRELEEARSSEEFLDDMDCDETWTESDKLIINPLLGMIKTSGALTKKTMDSIKKDDSGIKEIAVYELVSDHISRVSPAVDDLALSIYPPLVWEDAKDQAWKLKQILEEILDFLPQALNLEENRQWLEFVRKAVAHNAAEIQRIFIQHGLAELSLT